MTTTFEDINNALNNYDNNKPNIYIHILIAIVLSYIICIILFNIRCNFLRHKDDTVRKQRCFCITVLVFITIFITIHCCRQ